MYVCPAAAAHCQNHSFSLISFRFCAITDQFLVTHTQSPKRGATRPVGWPTRRAARAQLALCFTSAIRLTRHLPCLFAPISRWFPMFVFHPPTTYHIPTTYFKCTAQHKSGAYPRSHTILEEDSLSGVRTIPICSLLHLPPSSLGGWARLLARRGAPYMP